MIVFLFPPKSLSRTILNAGREYAYAEILKLLEIPERDKSLTTESEENEPMNVYFYKLTRLENYEDRLRILNNLYGTILQDYEYNKLFACLKGISPAFPSDFFDNEMKEASAARLYYSIGVFYQFSLSSEMTELYLNSIPEENQQSKEFTQNFLKQVQEKTQNCTIEIVNRGFFPNMIFD